MTIVQSALIKDLKEGLGYRDILWYLTVSDLKARYKRSVLGPFWMLITTGLASFGIGVVWSILWATNFSDFLPTITIGFIIWIFISGTISDGTGCFVDKASLLHHVRIPFCLYPFFSFSKNIVNLFHSLALILLVYIINPHLITPNLFLVIPGFLITLFDLYIVVYVLGLICARYRDIQYLILSFIPIVFFVSPILFKVEQLKSFAWIMYANPLTYLILIIREPLLGRVPDPFIYLGAISIGICACFALSLLFRKKYKEIIYWV